MRAPACAHCVTPATRSTAARSSSGSRSHPEIQRAQPRVVAVGDRRSSVPRSSRAGPAAGCATARIIVGTLKETNGLRNAARPSSAQGRLVEAAGIEPASQNHSGSSIYARVPRFGSRSSDAHGRAAVEPASLSLAGVPRGAVTRPARCWRSPQAAGAPAENGCLETRRRENSCWQVTAVPSGLTGTSDPRRAARVVAKPVETSAPPWLRAECSTRRGEAQPPARGARADAGRSGPGEALASSRGEERSPMVSSRGRVPRHESA